MTVFMISHLKATKPKSNPMIVQQGSDKSLPEPFMSLLLQPNLPDFVLLMLCLLEERLMICSFRVGCASCSDGKRAPTPRTVHFGRTCAPSGGSWSCRRPIETRSMRKSPDSSTVSGCTVCFTSQTRWYKHRPASRCSQSVTSRVEFQHC